MQNAKVLYGNSCALLPSWNSVHWAATWQTHGWNCCQGSVPHNSILAKHIPVQTLWLYPKVSIIPTDLGVGIIPEAYDLSSQSKLVKVHCQMDVGRNKCMCRSLTALRHSNSQSEATGMGTQTGWLRSFLTTSRSLSLHMTMDAHYYDFIFPETV